MPMRAVNRIAGRASDDVEVTQLYVMTKLAGRATATAEVSIGYRSLADVPNASITK